MRHGGTISHREHSRRSARTRPSDDNRLDSQTHSSGSRAHSPGGTDKLPHWKDSLPVVLHFARVLMSALGSFGRVGYGDGQGAIRRRVFVQALDDRLGDQNIPSSVETGIWFWLPTAPHYTPLQRSSAPFSLWGWPPGSAQGPHGPTQAPKLLTKAFPSGFVRHPSVPS